MKKSTVVLILTVLVVTLCLSASAEMKVGGWEMVKAEAAPLTENAQAAFDKATEKLTGAEYTPVALLATQVVAGTNYCILCQITPVVPDPAPQWALLYLYEDPQGNVEILNVYELYIDLHAYPVETQTD